MKKANKKKKKLRISGLILILLIIYLIITAGYYFFTMPVKRIIVKGNDKVLEKDIITAANINLENSIFKTSSSSIKKKIEKIDLVKSANIHKSLFGNITITIEENKVLFYNYLSKELYLSDQSKITDTNNYLGYPTLVNYVPSDILEKFMKGLSKIDEDIITMISEIEYSPDEYNDIVIDNERFLLRMNDSNVVYINIVNIEKLNKYQTIFAKVGSGGTLYLDSSSKNYIFDKDGENEMVTPEEEVDSNEN